MRKVHQQIGNTVKTFLESIENGSTKTAFKKVNRNTVIGLHRSSDLWRHPIETIPGIELCVTIQYCQTGIVTVGITRNKTMYCSINTGGYDTKTTKEYINAAVHRFISGDTNGHNIRLTISNGYAPFNIVENFIWVPTQIAATL